MALFAVPLCAALAALPPDDSKAYFTGLVRPPAPRVAVKRDQGPVILIVVDALRPDRMSAYGFHRPTTPILKGLADEGLVFTNFFVNGNWTRPTTASMLTGLLPASHGVENERDKLAQDFVTIAEVLKGAGVPTGAVVGNGNAGSAFGLGKGFDFYADTVKHWKGLPSAEQVVELAIPFVRAHRDQPFFLMLFFVDPHDPYRAPGDFENMFVEDTSVRLIRRPHWELGRYSASEIERMKATYDGAVRYTDQTIGRLFDSLRALGLYDRSTILVTADHGEAFGEHGVYLHSHHLYDEIVRVPLIMKTPKMSVRGAYNHFLFETIDLFPTIADLYGVAQPKGLPGVSLVRHVAQPHLNDPRRAVISEFNNFGIRRRMIRTYREKVIYAEPADRKEFMATVGNPALLPSVSFDEERIQFFDLGLDPFERKDIHSPELAKQPRFQTLLKKIKRYRSQRPKRPVPPIAESLDPETLRDLRALGYIQ